MAEKGIDDIEVVELDLLKGDHRQAEYRNRAGLSMTPALELEDGTTITESVAICRYLEALHPEPNLFGRDPREGAVIEMWTRRCELYAANPLMLATRYGHPALAALEPTDAAASERHRATAERMLKHVDRQLDGREFIAADRITMADIVMVAAMDFARMIRWRPPEALENVGRWYGAVRGRPAAKASL